MIENHKKTIIDSENKRRQPGARSKLKEYLPDIAGYENIFVCGPCWWGTYPMAVFSQLEKLDFHEK